MIPILEQALSALSRLPGIGRRSAERIAFYLLAKPAEAERLIQVLSSLSRISRCPRCHGFSEGGLCPICRDPTRDQKTICVVAHPWEIERLERTGEYHGLYHVLGGLLSPSSGIGAEDLTLAHLAQRVAEEGTVEVILALEPKLEGDLTAMHILRLLKPLGVKVSQLAHGIPVGRDLESADELTLGRALKGRIPL
ncbi:MAG: recombination mediator RecR [Candidatus Bipolaricaulota bacterium]|nr:recombination mediator RecR [Candidatus Bipolaricaulota bacterium]MDW8126931.1 recombination mediator RecR [Candidatus Bipolaricaulota bacterium]